MLMELSRRGVGKILYLGSLGTWAFQQGKYDFGGDKDGNSEGGSRWI